MKRTMKYLGLILVVVALASGQDLTKSINEKDEQLDLSRLSNHEKLRNFLEKARYIIREGNSTLGIPALDPFVSERIEVKIDEDVIKGSINVTDFSVTGLAGYKVDTAQLFLLTRKLTVGLTFPYIYSKGSYELRLALDDIEVYGNGDYTLSLTDLSFTSTVWLRVSPTLGIKKMETEISLGSMNLLASGLFNDESTSKILSDVLSDMAPGLVEDYQNDLTSAINNKVTILADQFLEGKTIDDITAILG